MRGNAGVEPPANRRQAVAVFLALRFMVGILMVWIYAAIRPRLGEGPKTPICAALVMWTLGSLFHSLGRMPTGVFPASMVGQFVETPIASVDGAWLYNEQ